jgi:hypothetical protein
LVNTLFGCEEKAFYSRIDNTRINFKLGTPKTFQEEKRSEKKYGINGASIVRMDRREAS